MPRLKKIILTFACLVHELRLTLKNERRLLRVSVLHDYKPSPEVLEAWKVPGGSLQPCKNRSWQEAVYSSWPPS